jgi:hypothetical protein
MVMNTIGDYPYQVIEPWVAPQAPEEPEMWEHFCPREGYDMYIGKGEPCNWCGLLENGESV